jgi:hypothetical protein
MASRLRANCRHGVATPFFSPTGVGDPSARVPAKTDPAPKRRTSRTVVS